MPSTSHSPSYWLPVGNCFKERRTFGICTETALEENTSFGTVLVQSTTRKSRYIILCYISSGFSIEMPDLRTVDCTYQSVYSLWRPKRKVLHSQGLKIFVHLRRYVHGIVMISLLIICSIISMGFIHIGFNKGKQ